MTKEFPLSIHFAHTHKINKECIPMGFLELWDRSTPKRRKNISLEILSRYWTSKNHRFFNIRDNVKLTNIIFLKVLTLNVQMEVHKSKCQPRLKARQNKVKKPKSDFFIGYARRTEQVTCSWTSGRESTCESIFRLLRYSSRLAELEFESDVLLPIFLSPGRSSGFVSFINDSGSCLKLYSLEARPLGLS